ncbi:HK97 gp10 family phage protein [Aminobacter sp. MDW-2]|uniref:HK97 gp10 family phage protein n=1 Tax=Aminobacter sp. MDW-2 TaxID=2666139 RepID=UPI0012B11713|nr:HK97 gp10 family phage protein [Aminobacter sp. MDW-2]MRX33219.1 HK97 gp10 family phage protein [Aminobacter sp. MDW-2]QNH36841.1 HK97 gp10 family phage protein [Aminobacter sp. MDW-2]
MASFAATVGQWAQKVEGALEAVFKEAAQELVSQLNQLVPVGETGFLRSSLMASTTAMPTLTRANPGMTVPADLGDILLVINSADLGDTIFLGYTANYAAFVHFGAQGRTPRPWVTMVAQRWEMIVAEKAREVKTRLGL